MAFVLTGLDIEAKAELVRRQLETSLTVKPAEMQWTLARTDHADADTEEAASALLRCVVRDPDPRTWGVNSPQRQSNSHWRAIPASPAPRRPVTVRCTACSHRATSTPTEVPHVAVHADGTRVDIAPATQTLALAPVPPFALPEPLPFGETRRAPLGVIAGARSGDKGGSANVGLWVRTEDHWRWLAHTLTVEKLCELLPETADLPVTRHLLPNLRAVNFVIDGILGQGVAYQARFDPQAKGLGEWLRSRHIDIPESFVMSIWTHPRTRTAAKDRARLRRT